jgi:SOS-response transcriptional repressor LexA
MLTEKQHRILNIIKNYIDTKKIPPTVREIGEIAGLTSTSTVQRYINELEKEGYIFKEQGCNRSIRIKEIS